MRAKKASRRPEASAPSLAEFDTGFQDLEDELRLCRETLSCASLALTRAVDADDDVPGPEAISNVVARTVEDLKDLEGKFDRWAIETLRPLAEKAKGAQP